MVSYCLLAKRTTPCLFDSTIALGKSDDAYAVLAITVWALFCYTVNFMVVRDYVVVVSPLFKKPTKGSDKN